MINKERLNNLSNEIWKGAIKLRGKFKAKDYPTVILPMIMIRRIECVLESKREVFKAELLQKKPDISVADLKKRIKIKEIKDKVTANKDNILFLQSYEPTVQSEVTNNYIDRELWEQLDDPIYKDQGGIFSIMSKTVIDNIVLGWAA